LERARLPDAVGITEREDFAAGAVDAGILGPDLARAGSVKHNVRAGCSRAFCGSIR
jgi:hypothetical protein